MNQWLQTIDEVEKEEKQKKKKIGGHFFLSFSEQFSHTLVLLFASFA